MKLNFSNLGKSILIFALTFFSLNLYSQNYNMGNLGTISTCSGNFYDSGGPSGAYGNNQAFSVTFCSSSGQQLWLQFTQFTLENNFDFLIIYNGPNTSSPVINQYTGGNSPGVVISSNPSNCLTVVFTSDGSVTPAGWAATIGCGTPPPPPPTPAGSNCGSAQQFCSGVVYNYPAVTGGGTAQAGPAYGCLGTQPNPTWFVMQIDTAGPITLNMQSSPALDIDFICWGPFNSLTGYCNNLTAGNIVDCSYSTASTEIVDIPNAQVGQVYVVLITNFSNQPNTITFNQSGGTGSTNCNILCNMTNLTATAGPCDPLTNMFSITGQVSVNFPPTSGTLTVSTNCGGTTTNTVITPPYSSPINYTINNVPANGANCNVVASFSADPTCTRTQPITPPPACNVCSVTASNNGPVCSGDSITLSVTTFNNANTYTWSAFGQSFSGQNLTIPTVGVPAGTYTVTATVSSSSCTATSTTNVVIRANPQFGTPTIVDATCNQSNGSITATTTSTASPFDYDWSNGVLNTPTISGLSAGTYTVTLTDANLCSSDTTFTVGIFNGASIDSFRTRDISCFAGSDGEIILFVTGGTPPLTYNWSPGGSNNDTISGLSAGTYNLILSDGNNCTINASYTLNQPTALVIDSSQITDVICNGNNSGAVEIFTSGGTGTHIYLWSNSENISLNDTLSGGSYSVTVSDQNSCSVSATYTVNEPTALVIGTPSIVQVSCLGGNNGSIIANASGGTGTINFNWQTTPPQSGSVLDTLIAGSYTLVVIDQNNCSDTATYTITEPAAALVIDSVSQINVACFGGNSGSLTAHTSGGSGGNNFLWIKQSNGSPLTGQTISNLTADTYNLTVTDMNGCQTTGSYIITQPTAIVLNPIVVNNNCFGYSQGSIDANGSGGTGTLTYNWSNSLPSGQTVSSLAAGTYNVTATDQNNCSVSTSATVNQPTQITFNAPLITNVNCFGGNNASIQANPTGGSPNPGYNYNWSNGITTQTNSNLIAGTYPVTVYDQYQCSASATYTVTEPSMALTLANASQVNVNCFGEATGSATVVITGGTPNNGYNYVWTNTVSTSNTAQSLIAGTFTVTVTDANGCSLTNTFTITQPNAPLLTQVTSSTNVSCNGGNNGTITTITQGGTAPYSYLWDANAGFQTDSFANNLPAGTYSIIVTDALNCTATTSQTLTEPTAIISNPIITPVVCFGESNGSIDINPTGGTSPYTFVWSDGQTTQTATSLAANIYTVTVYDFLQCSAVFAENVPQPALLTIDGTQQGESCPGFNDGTINVSAAGGITPYTFTLNGSTSQNPNSTGEFNPLAPGTYNIQVTDFNNCTSNTVILIGAALDDIFNVSYDTVSCYGFQDGAVHVEAITLLNSPFTYAINSGLPQYNGDFYELPAGPQVVTAINYHGCVTTIPVVVPQPLPVIANSNPDSLTIALGASGSVAIQSLNVLGSATYEWSPTTGLSCSDCPNPTITVYQPTAYTVTVSYMNGESKCEGSTTLFVDVLPETEYYIPNVFSPNGDGLNEVFNILGADIRTVDLRIFNRWGELLYASNNQWIGWDGTYKTALQSPGVYTYYAGITYLNGKFSEKKGTVTLVR